MAKTKHLYAIKGPDNRWSHLGRPRDRWRKAPKFWTTKGPIRRHLNQIIVLYEDGVQLLTFEQTYDQGKVTLKEVYSEPLSIMQTETLMACPVENRRGYDPNFGSLECGNCNGSGLRNNMQFCHSCAGTGFLTL